MLPDYYSLLGVRSDAPVAQITSAFRARAMELHPDRNSAPDATERFIAVREAFDILSDPTRRATYDSLRHATQAAPAAESQRASASTGDDAGGGSRASSDPSRERYEQWRRAARESGAREAQMPFADFVQMLSRIGKQVAVFGEEVMGAVALGLLSGVAMPIAVASPLFGLFAALSPLIGREPGTPIGLILHIPAAAAWAYYLYQIDMQLPRDKHPFEFDTFAQVKERGAMFGWMAAYAAFSAISVVMSLR